MDTQQAYEVERAVSMAMFSTLLMFYILQAAAEYWRHRAALTGIPGTSKKHTSRGSVVIMNTNHRSQRWNIKWTSLRLGPLACILALVEAVDTSGSLRQLDTRIRDLCLVNCVILVIVLVYSTAYGVRIANFAISNTHVPLYLKLSYLAGPTLTLVCGEVVVVYSIAADSRPVWSVFAICTALSFLFAFVECLRSVAVLIRDIRQSQKNFEAVAMDRAIAALTRLRIGWIVLGILSEAMMIYVAATAYNSDILNPNIEEYDPRFLVINAMLWCALALMIWFVWTPVKATDHGSKANGPQTSRNNTRTSHVRHKYSLSNATGKQIKSDLAQPPPSDDTHTPDRFGRESAASLDTQSQRSVRGSGTGDDRDWEDAITGAMISKTDTPGPDGSSSGSAMVAAAGGERGSGGDLNSGGRGSGGSARGSGGLIRGSRLYYAPGSVETSSNDCSSVGGSGGYTKGSPEHKQRTLYSASNSPQDTTRSLTQPIPEEDESKLVIDLTGPTGTPLTYSNSLSHSSLLSSSSPNTTSSSSPLLRRLIQSPLTSNPTQDQIELVAPLKEVIVIHEPVFAPPPSSPRPPATNVPPPLPTVTISVPSSNDNHPKPSSQPTTPRAPSSPRTPRGGRFFGLFRGNTSSEHSAATASSTTSSTQPQTSTSSSPPVSSPRPPASILSALSHLSALATQEIITADSVDPPLTFSTKLRMRATKLSSGFSFGSVTHIDALMRMHGDPLETPSPTSSVSMGSRHSRSRSVDDYGASESPRDSLEDGLDVPGTQATGGGFGTVMAGAETTHPSATQPTSTSTLVAVHSNSSITSSFQRPPSAVTNSNGSGKITSAVTSNGSGKPTSAVTSSKSRVSMIDVNKLHPKNNDGI